MSHTWIKRSASILIATATVAYGAYYWHSHSQITAQLKQVSPLVIASLIGLYIAMSLVLTVIYDRILRICGKHVPASENALLTLYSSIVNFFGPLQSGPGFRTVYLKRKYNVSIKAYASATIFYYGVFGSFNLIFMSFGFVALRFAPVLALVLALMAIVAWRVLARSRLVERFAATVTGLNLVSLVCTTGLQAVLMVVIYFVELHAVGVPASLTQAIVYAGAANLSLFVALTPGALGFRESFLYLSQRLHHLPGNAIVTANILDRGTYIVFLGCLFIIILAFHAKNRFVVSKPKALN